MRIGRGPPNSGVFCPRKASPLKRNTPPTKISGGSAKQGSTWHSQQHEFVVQSLASLSSGSLLPLWHMIMKCVP